ncbi:hypothetical protein JCM3765_002276 [Sporobolomyces pararoseus]
MPRKFERRILPRPKGITLLTPEEIDQARQNASSVQMWWRKKEGGPYWCIWKDCQFYSTCGPAPVIDHARSVHLGYKRQKTFACQWCDFASHTLAQHLKTGIHAKSQKDGRKRPCPNGCRRAWLKNSTSGRQPHETNHCPRRPLRSSATDDAFNRYWDEKEACFRDKETGNPLSQPSSCAAEHRKEASRSKEPTINDFAASAPQGTTAAIPYQVPYSHPHVGEPLTHYSSDSDVPISSFNFNDYHSPPSYYYANASIDSVQQTAMGHTDSFPHVQHDSAFYVESRRQFGSTPASVFHQNPLPSLYPLPASAFQQCHDLPQTITQPYQPSSLQVPLCPDPTSIPALPYYTIHHGYWGL